MFVTSISFLSRCIPDPSHLIFERFKYIRRFLDITDLDDLFRNFLADIYIAWRELLALCGISVGKCYIFSVVLVCQWLA